MPLANFRTITDDVIALWKKLSSRHAELQDDAEEILEAYETLKKTLKFRDNMDFAIMKQLNVRSTHSTLLLYNLFSYYHPHFA